MPALPLLEVPIVVRSSILVAWILVLAGLGAAVDPASAQEREDTVRVRTLPTTAEPDDVELPELDEPTTPGGAFLRAVLLPGWGHASIGSYTRGGFYFLAETTTAWMLLKVNRRLDAARDVRNLRADAVRGRLVREGVTDSLEIEDAIDADEAVEEARDLVDARDQQFEDWTALGVFLLFLSGADAFVSAHLADFPEPVDVGVRPLGPDRFEVGVFIPLPRSRPAGAR